MNRYLGVREAIEILKSFDLKTITTDEIIKILNSVRDQFMVIKTIPKDARICRTRVWDKLPDPIPISSNELSYNPNPSEFYGRANITNESIFYGSISTEKMTDYFNTNMETAKFDDSKIERKYFITSAWKLNKDIKVISVGNDLPHGNHLNLIRDNTIKSISLNEKIDILLAKEFDKFISLEFSKKIEDRNHHEYKISASYSRFAFDQGFDGIMYSSVGSNGTGANLAIQKELIDRNLISPTVAVFGTFYNRYKSCIQDYSMSGKIENGIIRWKDVYRPLPPSIKDFYTGISDDNSFEKNIPFQNLSDY